VTTSVGDKLDTVEQEGASWRFFGLPQDDDHPVVMVTWNDALAFCKWLSRREGLVYRLPSEAEWEFACRNSPTDTKPFNTGDTISTDQANYNGNFIYGKGVKGVYRKGTTAVGHFPPNARGLFDMHGNVFQWCQDANNDYGPGPLTDPHGSGAERNPFDPRVIRGGAWFSMPDGCRSAFRDFAPPNHISNLQGFRVVLEPLK